MKAVIKLFVVLLLASVLQAQTAAPAAPPRKKASKSVGAEVQALKDAVAAQQEQIKALSEQLQQTNQQLQQTNQQLQQQLQQAQTAAADAASKAAAAQTQASQQQQAVGELKGDVADLKTTATNTAATVQETQKNFNTALQEPAALHFKGITLTPGGFVAAEFVRRSRALGADISTPFNSLTMPGASQSQMSEFFGSGRQSRISLLAEGKLSNVKLSGYAEADFLAAGGTSTATQTNGYAMRIRQAWGQAKFNNGWTLTGGQQWSLLSETGRGLDNRTEALPMTIDPGYNVGFTFARQYGMRLTKDFGNKLSVGVSIENAQGTLTTHNNDPNFLLGSAGASSSYNSTSNYTFNPSPDLIAKVAFDPGFGHYEIYGLVDRFRDRIFPCYELYASAACGTLSAPSAVNAYNASKEGGGFGANARWTFADKHVVFGLHGFGGSGVGRYGAAQLSDLSINPNGTVHLIKSFQGLGTLEWHGKKLDLYSYAGVEYAGRSYGFDPNLQVLVTSTTGGVTTSTWENEPGYVGYGSPYFPNSGCNTETVAGSGGFTPGSLKNCAGDTRAVIEGTAGFWYRFYNGPKGKLQFGTQYSYVTRQTWSGANSATPPVPGPYSPEGLDSMIFTSLRYYLP